MLSSSNFSAREIEAVGNCTEKVFVEVVNSRMNEDAVKKCSH